MDEETKNAMKEMLGDFKTSILAETKQMVDAVKGKKPEGDKEAPTDMNALADLIIEKTGKNAQESTNKVYDTLFTEKMESLTTQHPAFGDHLASTDAYGDVIGDKIKGITDYGKRIETLGSVFKSFAEASANSSDSSDTRVSKAMQQKVKEHTDQRDEIKDKFLKGETRPEDFMADFFGTLESQMNELRK